MVFKDVDPERVKVGRIKLSALVRAGEYCEFKDDESRKHNCGDCEIPLYSRNRYCSTHTRWLEVIGKPWDECLVDGEGNPVLKKGIHFDVIRSKTVNDDVVIMRIKGLPPEEYRHLVIYTLDECEWLAKKKLSEDELKRIHEVKKNFGGTVIS